MKKAGRMQILPAFFQALSSSGYTFHARLDHLLILHATYCFKPGTNELKWSTGLVHGGSDAGNNP